MDFSVTFARHFARLVRLIASEPANVDDQKAALRALVTVSREGAVTLVPDAGQLRANDVPVAAVLPGMSELVGALVGHFVRQLRFEQGAAPGDMLGVARLLAGARPTPVEGPHLTEERLAALDPRTVHYRLLNSRPTPAYGVPVVAMDPAGMPAAPAAPAAQVPPAAPAAPAEPPAPPPPLAGFEAERAPIELPVDGFPSFEHFEVDVPIGAAELVEAPPAVAAPALAAAPLEPEQPAASPLVSEGEMLPFAAVAAGSDDPSALLAQLAAAQDRPLVTRLLDELVVTAERAQVAGRHDAMCDIFRGIVEGEARATDADLRRGYASAIRRLGKPAVLKAVAQMLPRRRDRAEGLVGLLARAGDNGVDALMEQLAETQATTERRVYFEALVKLNAGVAALVHMLGDPRWYAARNAAHMLGELRAPEADIALTTALGHADQRVRREAAEALGKVGSPRATEALQQQGLRDPAPEVRAAAALALGRRGGRATPTLLRALEEEPEIDVQLSVLAALGRLATTEAVHRLIKAAEPERGLFRKKPLATRLAAVQALGEARTPSALSALKALVNDREKDVREAVVQAVMRATGDARE